MIEHPPSIKHFSYISRFPWSCFLFSDDKMHLFHLFAHGPPRSDFMLGSLIELLARGVD